MPFKKVNIDEEIKKEKSKSPEFKKMYNWYKLVCEMTRIRKNKKVTQTNLAASVGIKQQVISRIETAKEEPSLGLFCSILDKLGYELKIVKKDNKDD